MSAFRICGLLIKTYVASKWFDILRKGRLSFDFRWCSPFCSTTPTSPNLYIFLGDTYRGPKNSRKQEGWEVSRMIAGEKYERRRERRNGGLSGGLSSVSSSGSMPEYPLMILPWKTVPSLSVTSCYSLKLLVSQARSHPDSIPGLSSPFPTSRNSESEFHSNNPGSWKVALPFWRSPDCSRGNELQISVAVEFHLISRGVIPYFFIFTICNLDIWK